MTDRLDAATLRQWEGLRERGMDRQLRNRQVAAVRSGDVDSVMPGIFPDSWPRPVVANTIDTTARDLAETLARIPSIECVTSNLTTDKAKKFAAKKTKVVHYYVDHSRLKLQLYSGADWFFTFSAMPIVVEPDFDARCPVFRIDSPFDAYWETDLQGNVKLYAKVWTERVGTLRYKFPELAELIGQMPNVSPDPFNRNANVTADEATLDVVKMYRGNEILLFLPERQGLVLRRYQHRLNRPPVVVAQRPKWDEHGRGQFDDVIWVWLARARMALYGLEAADKAVRAPLAVPDDVTQIAFGADAVIRTNEPDKVRRVPIELPNSSLIESQLLDQEISEGTRYPKARSGQIDASIITGRGVEALSSIYSTQIATAQDILADALTRAFHMAFEMDELYWPDLEKTVNGTIQGAPFTQTYVPRRDIAGDYTVSVKYGFAGGMDPNRLIVFLLQLQAAQAIDRGTMLRELPLEIDVEQLQRRIDIEQINDALKQGLFGTLANAPVMEMQGGPPAFQTLLKAVDVIKDRENGKPLHQALFDAYKPDESQQAMSPEDQLMQALMGGGGGGGMAPPGADNSQLGPGGSPDLAMVLAGLTNGGSPNMQFNVSRRMPA